MSQGVPAGSPGFGTPPPGPFFSPGPGEESGGGSSIDANSPNKNNLADDEMSDISGIRPGSAGRKESKQKFRGKPGLKINTQLAAASFLSGTHEANEEDMKAFFSLRTAVPDLQKFPH